MTIDANDILVLSMDGDDGDTTITDASDYIHSPITTNSAVQLSDAQFKFTSGTSSYHPTTADYWIIPDHVVWDFLVGDFTPFTIDMWVRFESLSAHRGFISQYQSSGKWWNFYWTTGNNLAFEGQRPFQNVKWQASWSPSVDTWYHIAFDRDITGQGALYVDGIKLTLTTDTNDGWSVGHAGDVFVGYARGKNYSHIGWIDEVRLGDVARYGGSDFTPETIPYGEEPPLPPPEVFTVDKYFVLPQIPRIKKRKTNPGFSVTPGMEVPVPIKLDKWDHIKNVPARTKKRNRANVTQNIIVQFNTPTSEIITLDKWFKQQPVPLKRFEKRIVRPSEFMFNFVETWQEKDGNYQDTGVFGFAITKTSDESATFKDVDAFGLTITGVHVEDFQLEDTEAISFTIAYPETGNEVFNSGVPGFVSANVIIDGVNESSNISGVVVVTREDNTAARFKCVLEFDQSLDVPRKPASLINKIVKIGFAAADMTGIVSDYIPIFIGICKHVTFSEDGQAMIMTGYDYGGVHQTKGEFISQNVTDVLTGTVGAGSAETINLGKSPIWAVVWNGNSQVKDGEDYFVNTLNGKIVIPFSSRVLQFPGSFTFNYMNPFGSMRDIIQEIASIKDWTVTEDNVTIADYSSVKEHPVISLSDESVIDVCRKFLELSGAKVETNLFPKLRVYSEVQNVISPPNTHVLDESEIFENTLMFKIDFDDLLNEQTVRSVQKVNANIEISGQTFATFSGSQGLLSPFAFSAQGTDFAAVDRTTPQVLVEKRIPKQNIASLSFSSSGRFFLQFNFESFEESITGASWNSFIDGDDFVIQLKHRIEVVGILNHQMTAFPAFEYSLTISGTNINYGGGAIEDVKVVTAQRPVAGISETLKGDVYENAYIETDQHCANICDAILLEDGNPYTCRFEIPVFVGKDMNIGDRIDIKKDVNVLFSGIIKTLNYTINLTNGENSIFAVAKGVGFGI